MHRLVPLVALSLLFAGCTNPDDGPPKAEEYERIAIAEDPAYKFELRVKPFEAGRAIDFIISHDGSPIDIINYETRNKTESLRTYLVDGGEMTVSVHENGDRYLVADVDVEQCPGNEANAVLKVHKKSPGRSGLVMEYGCM